MALDVQLKAQFAQTVAIALVATVGSAGDPTYGTPASYSARVEQKRKVVHGPNGRETISTHRIVVDAADVTPTIHDRLWLPADANGASSVAVKAREILEVNAGVNESGATDFYEMTI